MRQRDDDAIARVVAAPATGSASGPSSTATRSGSVCGRAPAVTARSIASASTGATARSMSMRSKELAGEATDLLTGPRPLELGLKVSDVLGQVAGATDAPALLLEQIVEVQRAALTVGGLVARDHGVDRAPDDRRLELGAGVQPDDGGAVVETFVKALPRAIGGLQHDGGRVVERPRHEPFRAADRGPGDLVERLVVAEQLDVRVRADDDVAVAQRRRTSRVSRPARRARTPALPPTRAATSRRRGWSACLDRDRAARETRRAKSEDTARRTNRTAALPSRRRDLRGTRAARALPSAGVRSTRTSSRAARCRQPFVLRLSQL